MNTTLHAPVYTLHIELEGIDSPVWRRLEVPAAIPLRTLHDIIQAVMGWHDSHLHRFEIGGARYGLGDSEYDEEEHDDSTVLGVLDVSGPWPEFSHGRNAGRKENTARTPILSPSHPLMNLKPCNAPKVSHVSRHDLIAP